MTQHLSQAEVAKLQSIIDGDWSRYCESDDFQERKFPGWLTLLIWVGLGALSWVPIIAAAYIIW